MRTSPNIFSLVLFFCQKNAKQAAFYARRTKGKNIFEWSYPDSYRDKLATIK